MSITLEELKAQCDEMEANGFGYMCPQLTIAELRAIIMGLEEQVANGPSVGRMMECCDIELAIESGQFSSIESVLTAVKARASSIQGELESSGVKFARRLAQIEHK
ncbi:hypothetical protein [Aeromonas caviae]|uniref:hypothetical protein n=1 Tax=Aeromonas caviae TaxID=648 RepID=UPI00385F2D7E